MYTRRVTSRWAVATLAAAVSVSALGACGSSSSTASKTTDASTAKTTVAGTSDVKTACLRWSELDAQTAQGPGGEEGPPTPDQIKQFAAGLKPTVDKMKAEAPDAISDDVDQISAIVDDAAQGKNPQKLDPSEPALGTPVLNVETWVFENCGNQQVEVTGVDYGFEGIPEKLEAGQTSIKFTNSAKDEEHEMALLKINPGADVTATELAAAIKKDPDAAEQKYGKDITFVADVSAKPGKTNYTSTNLDVGEYVAACFIPQGGMDGHEAHAQLGMVDSFTVS